MFREEQIRDGVAPRIAQLAIITTSLIAGPLVFLFVSISMVGTPDFSQLPAEQPEVLAMISVGMGLASLVLANAIPRIIAAQQRGQIDPKAKLEEKVEKLTQTYHVTTIIAAALFEGAAFLGVMAYQVDESLIGFCVGVVMLCCVACLFPTPGRAVTWVERQLQRVDDESDVRNSF